MGQEHCAFLQYRDRRWGSDWRQTSGVFLLHWHQPRKQTSKTSTIELHNPVHTINLWHPQTGRYWVLPIFHFFNTLPSNTWIKKNNYYITIMSGHGKNLSIDYKCNLYFMFTHCITNLRKKKVLYVWIKSLLLLIRKFNVTCAALSRKCKS